MCTRDTLYCLSSGTEQDAQGEVSTLPMRSTLGDRIDKPLRYVLAPAFTQGNTYPVGHALTVLFVCTVIEGFPSRHTIPGARIVA